MTLDGLTLHFIVAEITKEVIGCKVDKVHQPQPDTIILTLRAPRKNVRLLICAGASDSRMHTTAHKYENPKTPPMFCMFLRKYITGAKISKIEQIDLERVVNITLLAKDELGIPFELTLVSELMGKYSNVILKGEDNIIMDSMRHVTRSLSRVRCVLPSLEYELPLSAKLNPMTISRATLIELLEKRGKKNIKQYLSFILQGISGQTADEILCRYMPEGYSPKPKEAQNLADMILSFISSLSSLAPTLYMRKDATSFFYSPIKYISVCANSSLQYESANEAVDNFYYKQKETRLFNKKRAMLEKRVKKQVEKLSLILKKQLDVIKNAQKAEKHKNYGDIITANIYRISKGMDTLTAQDYTTGENISIALDKRLSPSANAQKNYKKYNRLKSGVGITAKRMQKNKKEIAFLESVQVSLNSCENMTELYEIEYELSKAGVIKTNAAKIKGMPEPSKPHKFLSSDGYTIYAGKNNRQNDNLTMKTAVADDIWLHTKDIPGAHVIIAGAKGETPEKTLFEAAVIAAWLSKAKGSLKVAVDYTVRKNVRKPNGSKPGMVIYEKYNTILADPSSQLFEQLRIKD